MAPLDPATVGAAAAGINAAKKIVDSVTARSESKKAHLEMQVDRTKIYIHNKGPGAATDIKVFIDDIPEDANAWNGFAKNDLPFRKSLNPGQETHRLWCGPCFGGPQSINYKITWINEDNTSGETKENDFRLF
jgi:hypothetical protein